MLSRVANSIYWMARYVERAENLARFVEVTWTLILDQPESGAEQWEPLVRATGDEDFFHEHYDGCTPANVRQFLTFDHDYHSSIATAVSHARENARTVREAISSETWEQLNAFYHFVRDASRKADTQRDAEFYDEIVHHCYKFNGILDATMTRGNGWHFANVGRLLERADKTSRILDVKYFTLLRNVNDVDTTFDDLLWSAVLRSASGFEMYRKQYHALTVGRIADFLILDRRFPRAISYCVEQARDSLAMVAAPMPASRNPALHAMNRLIEGFDSIDAGTIIDNGMHEFTDSVQRSLNEIGEHIAETYFAQREFIPPVHTSPEE